MNLINNALLKLFTLLIWLFDQNFLNKFVNSLLV